MAPIRNGCIARGVTATPGFVVVYTVPAENALILKSIWAQQTGAVAADLHVYMRSADTVALVELHAWTFESGLAVALEFWTVLNAGDIVLVNGTLGPATYWIAGAVLPYAGGGATLPLQGDHLAIADLDPATQEALANSSKK